MMPALSIHAYLNRIAPSSSSAPIKELSPSELDYTYVTYGFLTPSKAWRYISWTVYAVLLAAGAAHVVNGTDKIARRSKARRNARKVENEGTTSTPASALGSTRAAAQQADAKMRYRKKALINGTVSFLGAAWLAAGIRRMVLEDNGTTLWLTKRVSKFTYEGAKCLNIDRLSLSSSKLATSPSGHTIWCDSSLSSSLLLRTFDDAVVELAECQVVNCPVLRL